jgi:hypothetical protein
MARFDTLLDFTYIIADVFFARSFEGDFGRDNGYKYTNFVAFVIDFAPGPLDFAVGYSRGIINNL